MSINSLSNKNAPNVVASASLQSNGATEVRKRKAEYSLRESVSAQGREGRGFDSDPGRNLK
jgi:hypothetical protein